MREPFSPSGIGLPPHPALRATFSRKGRRVMRGAFPARKGGQTLLPMREKGVALPIGDNSTECSCLGRDRGQQKICQQTEAKATDGIFQRTLSHDNFFPTKRRVLLVRVLRKGELADRLARALCVSTGAQKRARLRNAAVSSRWEQSHKPTASPKPRTIIQGGNR